MTTLHLVRHGQSEWNAAGRLQGQTAHVKLSALGREQARATTNALRASKIDAIFSSDLVRALQTAEVIAAAFSLDVRLAAGLREREYGTFEGRLSKSVLEATCDVDWTDPDVRIGGGESIRDVFERVGQTLTGICTAHDHGTIAIVSHGDTIRVALAVLADAAPDQVPWSDVPNGSITTVRLAEHRATRPASMMPLR